MAHARGVGTGRVKRDRGTQAFAFVQGLLGAAQQAVGAFALVWKSRHAQGDRQVQRVAFLVDPVLQVLVQGLRLGQGRGGLGQRQPQGKGAARQPRCLGGWRGQFP